MDVDVVIPCHNAALFVREAVQSALDQTHSRTTIIAVDDGSTDATVRILEEFGHRITLLRQPRGGVSAARNRALDAGTAAVVAFLDADDRWHPEKLSRQLAFLDAHPECGLIHTGIQFIDEQGVVTAQPRRPVIDGDCLTPLLRQNAITTSAVMIRRRVLGAERFATDLHAGEDWDLWLRLATATRVGYLDEPLTDYRWHDANTTHQQELMMRGEVVVMDRAIARGLDAAQRASAARRRRRLLVALAHSTYERGDRAAARRLFTEAGTALDWVGYVRYLATWLPDELRHPLRRCWRRLIAVPVPPRRLS